jgi:hypothetical protein
LPETGRWHPIQNRWATRPAPSPSPEPVDPYGHGWSFGRAMHTAGEKIPQWAKAAGLIFDDRFFRMRTWRRSGVILRAGNPGGLWSRGVECRNHAESRCWREGRV